MFAFDPAPVPTLPVAGSTLQIPVRRVYCIGRNYAAHAVEMGHDPDREPPFFFAKQAQNIHVGERFTYPAHSSNVHHEIELVAVLGRGGRDIPTSEALACVYGYGVGLDMTLRDLQDSAKKMSRPWGVAKAFEHSAPCTPIVPVTQTGHPDAGAIWLKINGEIRQEGDLNQMIWKIPEMIAVLSQYFELAAGDVVMTGTPSGVGPVQRGDVLHGHVAGVGDLHLAVV